MTISTITKQQTFSTCKDPTQHSELLKTRTENLLNNRWQRLTYKIFSLNLTRKPNNSFLQKFDKIHLYQKYYPEILDPKHHHVSLSYRMFKIWRERYQSIYSFQEFLNSKIGKFSELMTLNDMARQKQEDPKSPKDFEIDFIPKDSLYLWRIRFKKNCLLDSKNAPLEGTFRFVIGLDGNIYAHNKANKRMQHTSFFRSSPLISAGEIQTDETGKVIQINSYSGRFPGEKQHFDAAITIFERNGFDSRHGDIDIDFDPEARQETQVVYVWEAQTS